MGKKTKKYPDYSGGSVQINGQTVATANRKNNTVTTSYNMPESERKIYDSVQSGLSQSLENLMSISDPQREEWTKQLDAIKAQGISNIENIYTPMETNLRNDIASRFGNLDNSVFMDNLNKITNKKSQAVANLSNSLLSAQDTLYANELSNRINVIALLNNLNSAINNNMLNYTNAAVANSQYGNNYNQNAYNASLANGATGSILSGLAGGVGSMTSAYGAMSLNPSIMAAGYGLSALSKYI